MDKKWFRIFGLGFVFVFVIKLVSAAIDLEQGGNQIIDWIREIFSPFFAVLLKTSQFDDFFFAKVLLLILLFIVISAVVKKMPLFERNKFASTIVSVVVSILSVRYIPQNEFFEGILLPYSTLGVSIIVFLPFVIYFFFVHKSDFGYFGRRAAWAIYGIVFLTLWWTRKEYTGSGADTLYLAGLGLVVLAFMFDKAIHKYLGLHEIGRFEEISKKRQRRNALRELDSLEGDLEAGRIKQHEYGSEKARLQNVVKELS